MTMFGHRLVDSVKISNAALAKAPDPQAFIAERLREAGFQPREDLIVIQFDDPERMERCCEWWEPVDYSLDNHRPSPHTAGALGEGH